MQYKSEIKKHLAKYKTETLGVRQDGVYKKDGRKRAHILPQESQRLNILETIRDQFWRFKDSHPEIRLHPDFHHLNSSQAMCFNLFYPFFGLQGVEADVLLDALEVRRSPVAHWEFEYVADSAEGTNFDFFVRLEDGRQLFFEVKFTEDGFAKETGNAGRLKKLDSWYRPRLEGKVKAEFLDPSRFFSHYQLFRNIAYAEADGGSVVFFVSPSANPRTRKELEGLHDLLEQPVRKTVRTTWIEDLVNSVRTAHPSDVLGSHFEMFEAKYLPPT